MIKGLNVHFPGSGLITDINYLDPDWVRVDIDIEDKPEAVEAMLDRLSSVGVKVLAQVGDRTGNISINAWKYFVNDAIIRYGRLIHGWAFLNEPNNERFWRRGKDSWRAYVRYAEEKVRTVWPNSLFTGPNLMDHNNLESWLRYALENFTYDRVAMHFYPNKCDVGALSKFLYRRKRWYTPCFEEGIKHIIADYYHAPLWIAETGARESEFPQTFIPMYMTRAYSEPGVDAVFWYHIKDDPRYPDNDWGLLTSSGIRKGSYYAFSILEGEDG